MEQRITEHNAITGLERTKSKLSFDVHDPPELPPHLMSVTELADRCMSEVNNYRNGEPSDNQYTVELFRRALMQRDALAWEMVQQRFSELVLQWMRSHPMRKAASRFDSDENYVAQAFTRFWQATAVNQKVEFRSLAAALRYLRATLNGAIYDTLRAYVRARELPLPESGEIGEFIAREQDDGRELWEAIKSLLADKRQQRVAYLLFHCHLKPREIVHYCSEEFSDVQEIYRLRCNIFARLLRNAHYIRWQLGKA